MATKSPRHSTNRPAVASTEADQITIAMLRGRTHPFPLIPSDTTHTGSEGGPETLAKASLWPTHPTPLSTSRNGSARSHSGPARGSPPSRRSKKLANFKRSDIHPESLALYTGSRIAELPPRIRSHFSLSPFPLNHYSFPYSPHSSKGLRINMNVRHANAFRRAASLTAHYLANDPVGMAFVLDETYTDVDGAPEVIRAFVQLVEAVDKARPENLEEWLRAILLNVAAAEAD